ncbi:hypothetical protein MMC16_007527 [Acarospora aff. strigata]|nr:hypothetical protein [Acarospora aff. strigata]
MREVNDDDDADGERDRWVAARKEEEGIVGHSSDVVALDVESDKLQGMEIRQALAGDAQEYEHPKLVGKAPIPCSSGDLLVRYDIGPERERIQKEQPRSAGGDENTRPIPYGTTSAVSNERQST